MSGPTRAELEHADEYERLRAYIKRNTIGDAQHEMLCLLAKWSDEWREARKLTTLLHRDLA